MIFIARQTEILENLSQILYKNRPNEYDYIYCEYNYLDEYDTVSSAPSFQIESKFYDLDLSDGDPTKNMELSLELRSLMKNSTGGEWTSFVLTLDKNGQARTKFMY